MKKYIRKINIMVLILFVFLIIACNNEMSNIIYEPISSTSFNKQDTLYSFQYMISNKYVKQQQPFLRKNSKSNMLKNYYWFENGKLFNTQGNFSGKLLHGNYIEKYKSGQIKSKGKFSYGLKDKSWLNYYDSGVIKSIEKWKNGIIKERSVYDGSQKLITDLKFFNGKKNGWEYIYDSITIVSRVKYKKGNIKKFSELNEI